MVSDKVTIFIDLDKSAAEAKIDHLQRLLDDITRREAQVRMQIIRTGKMGVRMARAVIGLFRSLVNAMGISLNAMSEVTLLVISNMVQVASAWLMLQTALSIGSYGLLAGVGLFVAALSLAVSIAAMAHVAQGNERALNAARKIDAVIASLESLVRAPGRWGTY